MLIIIVIGLAGSFGWWELMYKVKKNELNDLRTEREKTESELNAILAMKPQLSRLRKEVAEMEKELDSLRSIFPDQKEIPKLIKEITRISYTSGIKTLKFNPLPDVEREFYIENNYQLSVMGFYHDLAHYFAHLANIPLLINVLNVSLSAERSSSESTGNSSEEGAGEPSQPRMIIKADFTITTFSSKR